jgi:GH18 family chitinase
MAHADVDIPDLLALKALRAQNPRLLILLSVGDGVARPIFPISSGYRNHLNDLSLKEMSDLLDWFNLMAVDYYG